MGSEIVSSEEQGEHGSSRQFMTIGWPDHAWEWVTMNGMGDRGAGFVEVSHIQPGCFESPAGRAISP